MVLGTPCYDATLRRVDACVIFSKEILLVQEYITKAFVLHAEHSGEADLRIHLFTEKQGHLVALARAARKPMGKLAGHLQPLSYVQVRVVERKGAQIVDALCLRRASSEEPGTMSDRIAELGVAHLVMRMTALHQPDHELWKALRSRGFISAEVLKALGFDATHARCAQCSAPQPRHFVIASAEYVCATCLKRYARPREVVLQ